MPKLNFIQTIAFPESGKCEIVKDWIQPHKAEIEHWTEQEGIKDEKFAEKRIWQTAKRTSLGKQVEELWTALEEIEAECQTPGWDGYGAEPVSQDALQEIRKLLTLLPSDLSTPDIVPEPNGKIGLEWRREKDKALVLSVEGKGMISYVALLGAEASRYGMERFTTTIPQFIQREILPFFAEEY